MTWIVFRGTKKDINKREKESNNYLLKRAYKTDKYYF